MDTEATQRLLAAIDNGIPTIQRDHSGVGHCWRNILDECDDNEYQAIIDEIADEDGEIRVGQTANIGGQNYRVVLAK